MILDLRMRSEILPVFGMIALGLVFLLVGMLIRKSLRSGEVRIGKYRFKSNGINPKIKSWFYILFGLAWVYVGIVRLVKAIVSW